MSKLVPHKVHKYRKAKLGNKIIYRCMIPDCPHYVRRELVTSRMSICWNCNQPFILPGAPSLLKSMPWCKECEKKRKVKEVEVPIPQDIMAKLMKDLG